MKPRGATFQVPLLTLGPGSKGSTVLFYDGHSGYDYEAAWRDPILAAGDGILCATTSANAISHGVCPYVHDPFNGVGATNPAPTPWDKWHDFYIVHSGGYSTWYLHADDLTDTIKGDLATQGYSIVRRLQQVGYVGNKGLEGSSCLGTSCKHLHFELRMNDDTAVDPYGNGNLGSVLWGAEPPQ
jgi:murein DD-endopeptidase MepM/ murein hydrolase activator NlpD